MKGQTIRRLHYSKIMGLFEQINEDIKSAMRAKDTVKLGALRGIKSALLIAKTEKGGDQDLNDEVELKVLQKLAKQRKESAEVYEKNNRPELAEKEMGELKAIEAYLPKQMSADELRAAVEAIIKETGASSMKDMGKVMGIASKKLAGKADGKAISATVKEILG